MTELLKKLLLELLDRRYQNAMRKRAIERALRAQGYSHRRAKAFVAGLQRQV